ncbi:enoyl-CoA hydratase/isomerase family protein [Burkholderia thailandensis 34]|uniref:enoyl-CoA hydratase/isomerase family protein n=1 Tax=Burkholderia thailandensis TaxID=57975 RepID=UPI0005D955EB|nr:enoyl-CoA hydratase-related protein [Burkholderia thailandensis]AJY31990.1 enoyl-CoA hydratase/isomerase family protein [Burkholderia thailandensis 34]AOJ58895.1 enoyl-CoA hydratase [Burkholderia thailandensis]KXF58015.1 enoyl-CoA hydratase [Burkholderia thailandensis]PNE77229.1 enoyl-CoA hydratase [Burkholderia thailandensis]
MTVTTSSTPAPLHVAHANGVVFATLNRPAKRNALSDDLVAALDAECERAAGDCAARAFVLRGAGGTFCAGGDFGGFNAMMREPAPAGAPDPIAASNRRFGALLERLATLPMPTLAVVEGAAAGGGCGLAAACDRVLIASDAYLSMPETSLGLPPAQIAPFIVARAGAARGRWLMLTARRLSAADALHAGLVDAIAGADGIERLLRSELARVLACEPAALRATKRIVADALRRERGRVLDAAAGEFAAALRSGIVAEGLAALSGTRLPSWASDAPALPETP